MVQLGGAAPGMAGAGRAVRLRTINPFTLPVRQLEAEQERWFLWLPVLFGAGVALYFALPTEPAVAATLLPAALAFTLFLTRRKRGVSGLVWAALLAIACGVAAAKLRTEAVRAPVLSARIGPVDMRGIVELIEPRATGGQRLTLSVTDISGLDPRKWPAVLRVRASVENPELQPGDLVRLRANLSPPPWPSLPGDYDFARAAWFQSLGAVGFANGAATRLVADAPATLPLSLQARAVIERARQAIGRRILAALPGETGAIANALITGERGGISDATNQAYRDAGLFHILSISGLHMVIMAGAVFSLIRLSLAAIPSIALRYPIKKWAAAGAMLGALAYLLISGSAFATVRSYIMISIMFLAVLLDRPAVALRNVALAALGILVLWPESLFDAGFQMSFAAVVCLVSVYEWLRTREERRAGGKPQRGPIGHGLHFLGDIVTSTLVASLSVAPFGIYHFHNTQQFAVLANVIAIPVCNLVVMPAALAALMLMPLGLEAGPLWVMGWGIEAMGWCARLVAALPGAVGRLPSIPTLAFALMLAGGLWAALWGTRWRVLGAVPILIGLLLAPTARHPDVLIGRGGELIAVRGEDGLLSALGARPSSFELARWLEHDGDSRPITDAVRARAFQCDRNGCTARVKGLTVAVPSSAATARPAISSCSARRARRPARRAASPLTATPSSAAAPTRSTSRMAACASRRSPMAAAAAPGPAPRLKSNPAKRRLARLSPIEIERSPILDGHPGTCCRDPAPRERWSKLMAGSRGQAPR
jgi:competence protein ComEC